MLDVTSTGTGRTFAPVAGNDQWLRCSHTGTALDQRAEVVTLASPDPDGVAWETWAGTEPEPAGLAFDLRGCLYHGVPERGQLQRAPWRPGEEGSPIDLLAPPALPEVAVTPVALAADRDEHLFLLDGPGGTIAVLDLADGRTVRVVAPELPVVDLAADGNTILAATTSRTTPLLSMEAFGLVLPVALDPPALAALAAVPAAAVPAKVAVGPRGERWLLLRDGDDAWAVPVSDDRRELPLRVDGATDLELDGEGRLVLAGPPGGDLRRFGLGDVDTIDVGLRARHYDGRGIVRTPEGGIGYWRADRDGFRLALEARRRYVTAGHVDLHRLDGGAYQRRWGRLFVEACVPAGTSLRVSVVTADDEPGFDEPEGPSIPRVPPTNVVLDTTALPPAFPPLVATGRSGELEVPGPVHRRETGSEVPWAPVELDDRFEVYETPVLAPPGRHLWVRLHLSGPSSAAPRVRAVRVEVPGHDLLSRLPATYRRDPVTADFLHRYLGLIDGILVEAEGRAARRDLLLDPFGAPAEVLPWLASLVGMTLDGRWPERAKRQMVDEAICLFRRRGTIAALHRMLQILLDCDPVIVETFRFRGVGGGAEGEAGEAGAVVGVDLRVGAQVGQPHAAPLEGTTADAYRRHAHRFKVLIPRDLDEEQLAAVEHLLELHRPAHTIVELCTVGRGMRVGIGLHAGLTTMVGPGESFSPSVVGDARLGGDLVLGKARAGVRLGGTVLGDGMVVDP